VGQRSKVTQLPAEVRNWLDATLAEKNFGGYKLIVAELARRGFVLSKSSVHRYGANLEHKLEAIRASTEAARQIANMSPDDADQRSAAVMSMLQTEIFNVLIGAKALNDERDPGKKVKILSSLSANVAKLARASIHQKKHELEIRGKTEAAADKVARLAKKGGMSASTVDEIKRAVLGIAA
jgi:hypothetical protein